MSRLRVGLDATPVIAGRTGSAVYVTALTRALEELDVEVHQFAVGRAHAPPPAGCRHLRIPARFVHRSWSLGGPPRPERLTGPVDLIHVAGWLAPPSRLPVVLTVHDLAALDRPDLHAPRLVEQLTGLLRHIDRATIVLTISEATAATLESRGVERERIVVTPLASAGLPDPKRGRVVSGPYLLSVGEQMPRKGLPMLFSAFAAADLGDVRLVHAGPASTQTPELRSLIERLGMQDRIDLRGYVDGAELATLFRDAIALCFPSLAEGFGLPILEAMGAGTPVIASDIPAAREVAGGAATLVPAGNLDAWVAALEHMVHHPDERARWADAGRQRASEFTWERCAIATIGAYERALGGS